MTLLLYQIEALPFAIILRKTKYIYVFFVLALCMIRGVFKRRNGGAFLVIGLFFLHTILFGYIYINPIVEERIDLNVSQMMWYLLMVLVTYIYVAQNNLFETFIYTSFCAATLQLLIALLLHPQDIVNPVWGLMQTFAGGIRYKTTFGFVHAGYLSNATYLIIVLSLFVYELNKNYKGLRKKIMWLSLCFANALAIEMMLSAAERTAIISSAILLMIYFAFVIFKIRVEKKTCVAICVIGLIGVYILAFTGVFAHIWENSNRALNISINYPVFKELGNLWTGMGYVDNSGFNKQIMAFGVETSSLDMYYVYIFFTTGILGCIIIGTGLLIMLIRFLFIKKTNFHILNLGLYISLLFYSFWQCAMITYRYVSPTIFFVIFLCGLTEDFCMEKKNMNEGSDKVDLSIISSIKNNDLFEETI